MQPTMQNNKVVETAYLLRQNKANLGNKRNVVGIDIDKKYTIKCNGVKKTSVAKKTTAHKIEAQINAYSNMVGDCSPYAVGKAKNDAMYSDKRKDARKKLKAK